MQVISDPTPARKFVRDAQGRGLRLGLVPTMGALHVGHRSLIEAARKRGDSVVVSLYVNPRQFGPQEDLSAYPRPLSADLALCSDAGVDLVFTPNDEVMYPPGAQTTITVSKLSRGLCGDHRPGHFDGVATVVIKLFHLLPADRAYFGEKDYQQLQVVRRLVRDLDVPMEIVGCPTIRDPDGLAVSSRNVYLSPEERLRATSLNRALFAARDRVGGGERRVEILRSEIQTTLRGAGVDRIDYVEIVDAEDLSPLSLVDRPSRICGAVRIGTCRLIDNVPVDANPQDR